MASIGSAFADLKRKGATRGSVAAWLLVCIAAVAASAPLSDNSFLTHLTTGIRILDGSLPSRDPYSYTAFGRPWVIQSWFASLLYGATYRIGHGLGLRLMNTLLCSLLALLVWRLTNKSKSIVVRVAACVPALLIGVSNWGPRPLLFGLIGFMLVLLVLREERDPRWLIPVMWVWVNTHGSFPMGLVLIGVYGFGVWCDGDSPRHAFKTFQWTLIGVLLGAINPLGPKMLWFPVELLSKQQVLSHMIEWQAPSFQSSWQRLFLVTVLGAAVLAPKLAKGERFRLLIPAMLFSMLGFIAMRNIATATFLLAPLLAAELGDLGSMISGKRARVFSFASAALLVVTVLSVSVRLAGPSFDFSTYPGEYVTWLKQDGRFASPHRVVTQDFVGNYLEFRFVGKQPVFVDDRVDMFPESVVDDELTLVKARHNWEDVLNRWHIDTVLWERNMPLSTVLAASSQWHEVTPRGMSTNRRQWVIFERNSRYASYGRIVS